MRVSKRNAALKVVSRFWDILFYTDIHFPHQDDHALERLLDHAGSEDFSHAIDGGDFLDAYTVSSFDKDPRRIDQLPEEVGMANEFSGKIQKRVKKKVKRVKLQGNHEDRVPRYLRKNAPAFERFPTLQLPSMLEVKKFGIDYRADGEYRIDSKNLFKHGVKVAKGAGNSVRREMNDHWCNVYMGHVHRQAIVRIRKGTDLYVGAEAGCLCRLDPEYIKGTPDWHQGWITVRIDKKTGEAEVTEHQPS